MICSRRPAAFHREEGAEAIGEGEGDGQRVMDGLAEGTGACRGGADDDVAMPELAGT